MNSLLTMLQQAEAERDRCAAAWRVASNAHAAIAAQYDQLLAYRREYEQRWIHQFSDLGQIELVRSYHGFMLRLTQAVEHQQGTVQDAATRATQARAQLLAREVRVASIRKLLERRQQAARTQAGRREQKFNDEMASRQSHGRHGSHDTHDSALMGLTSTF
jgi:flagellar protein FliJ